MSCVSPSTRTTSRWRKLGAAALILLAAAVTTGAGDRSAIDLELARRYFDEAATLSDRDAGGTWGQSLFGPTLFVDRASRMLVANQPDGEGLLAARDGVWVGRLPDDVNCANTATDWAGVHWTMLVWPLPEDPAARGRLMLHESFHRIQDDLGLPMRNPENRHLDTREGRTWLQLEWRALDRALATMGAARLEAIRDTLAFRARRHRIFATAASEERALELNEGLAEYTGVRGAHREGERIAVARAGLAGGPEHRSFVRSFAYASGPAYGVLLDAADDGWRSRLDRDADLGTLLAVAYDVDRAATSESADMGRAAGYDGESLSEAEAERDRIRQETARRDRQQLYEGPILILPLGEGVRYSFNPSNLRPLDELGTVYPTMRVTDDWGVLEVDGGALLLRTDGRASVIHVSAPARSAGASGIQGKGWALTLNPGWTLEPADRIGDYRLVTR